MRRIFFVLATLSLALIQPVALAEQVRGLYTTTVLVSGQSPQERAEVLPLAFQQVLTKVTGKSVVEQGEKLQALAENAGRYVAQFRYVRSRSTLATPAALKLWVQFDKNALDNSLKGIAPIWSSERPLVLALVAYDFEGKRRLLSSGDSAPVAVALRKMVKYAGQVRGVPLVLPVYDRQDQSRLRAADIWSGFYNRIDPLLVRYAADASLILRIKVVAGELGADANAKTPQYKGFGRWLMQLEDATSPARSLANDALDKVLLAATGGLAANLAEQYAQVDSVDTLAIAESHQLTVAGINGYGDYRRVLAHLEGRSGVNAVRLVSVGGDEIQVALELAGDLEQFNQSLRLGRYLQPELRPVPLGLVGDGSELRYRVIP